MENPGETRGFLLLKILDMASNQLYNGCMIKTHIANIIKSYQKDKRSITSIAKEHDVSTRVIRNILEDRGVPIRSKTHYRKKDLSKYGDDIIKQYLKGESTRDIASKYNINKNTVIRFLEENDIPLRQGNISKLEKFADIIIESYKNLIPVTEISESHGVSPAAIRNLLKRHGIELSQSTISPYITLYDNIVELYESGLSTHDIALRLGIKSKSSVIKALRKRGVALRDLSHSIRQFEIDETVFDSIDGEYQAYFLGLLYADGNNYSKRNMITLVLKEEDNILLQSFLNFLKTTIPLRNRKNEGGTALQAAVITNKHLSQKLYEWGVVDNKTHKIEFPLWLDPKLWHHFIRGYFDGDGSVFLNRKDYCFSLVGTKKFLTKVQEILINECDLNKTKLDDRFPERETNIRNLRYSGNKQLQRIYAYLYEGATIFMQRKFNIFKTFC